MHTRRLTGVGRAWSCKLSTVPVGAMAASGSRCKGQSSDPRSTDWSPWLPGNRLSGPWRCFVLSWTQHYNNNDTRIIRLMNQWHHCDIITTSYRLCTRYMVIQSSWKSLIFFKMTVRVDIKSRMNSLKTLSEADFWELKNVAKWMSFIKSSTPIRLIRLEYCVRAWVHWDTHLWDWQ